MSDRIKVLTDLDGCLVKAEYRPETRQYGPHHSLTLLQQSDYDEHYGYKPPQEVYIFGRENLARLVDALQEIIGVDPNHA